MRVSAGNLWFRLNRFHRQLIRYFDPVKVGSEVTLFMDWLDTIDNEPVYFKEAYLWGQFRVTKVYPSGICELVHRFYPKQVALAHLSNLYPIGSPGQSYFEFWDYTIGLGVVPLELRKREKDD